MCGEHHGLYYEYVDKWGSSPHVRGARSCCVSGILSSGIIPACAGSTGSHYLRVRFWWDHPRMCGEHNVSFGITNFPQGSSPHVRGALASAELT